VPASRSALPFGALGFLDRALFHQRLGRLLVFLFLLLNFSLATAKLLEKGSRRDASHLMSA
jgi:hypothetical protein